MFGPSSRQRKHGVWISLQKSLSLFISLTWLSAVIYYMLGQLLSDQAYHKTATYLRPQIRAGDSRPDDILAELGFIDSALLAPQQQYKQRPHYNDTSASSADLPVFVLALHQCEMPDFPRFLGGFRKHFPHKLLLVYMVDLNIEEEAKVRLLCQGCTMRRIQWDSYPTHVAHLTMGAYRPLLIQASLKEFGAVFWCSVSMTFNSSDLSAMLEVARRYGVAAWSLQQYPTSAFTHHNMFRYFNTSADQYYFHRMVDPTAAIFYNIDSIRNPLMLLWLQCALSPYCISPPGAQPHGCNFMQRPKYLYTGCHMYDVSAFNILLGQLFGMETPYLVHRQPFTLDDVSARPQQKTAFSPWYVLGLRT